MIKAVVGGLLATLLAMPAVAGNGIQKGQSEEGTVMLPGPSPNSGEGCWQGWARRFYIVSQGANSGPLGSVVEIDESTWNGKFKLDVTGGGAGTEDLDVHYFIDLGKLDPNDPSMMNIVQSTSYQTAKAGGESGMVPPETKHAIICLRPGTGFDAQWTYKAAPPKKKKK